MLTRLVQDITQPFGVLNYQRVQFNLTFDVTYLGIPFLYFIHLLEDVLILCWIDTRGALIFGQVASQIPGLQIKLN